MFWILMILVASRAVIAPPANSGGYIGETSFEFKTKRTFSFNAGIEELLMNAQNRDLNVTMTQKCSDPVTFKFGKCDIAYYRQENKQNELTLVFDQNGTLFLLNATRIACDNGWNPDGAIHFKVYTENISTCKFTFKTSGAPEKPEDYLFIDTPIRQFYYFQKHIKQPPHNFEKDNTVLYQLGSFFLLVAILAIAMLIIKCVNSHGLGDDKTDDALEMKKGTVELQNEEQSNTPYSTDSDRTEFSLPAQNIVPMTGSQQ